MTKLIKNIIVFSTGVIAGAIFMKAKEDFDSCIEISKECNPMSQIEIE